MLQIMASSQGHPFWDVMMNVLEERAPAVGTSRHDDWTGTVFWGTGILHLTILSFGCI